MNRFRDAACLLAALSVLLACSGAFLLCWHLAGTADAVAVTVRALPGRVDALTEVVRGFPNVILPPVLAVADARLADATRRADGQVTALRADLMPRVDALVGQVAQVRSDLKPTLDIVAAMTATANQDLVDARPAFEAALNPTEVAGVVRDTRFLMARAARTAGHIEQASDDFRGALPKALLTWEQIGSNVESATEASRRVSENAAAVTANLAAATKPLPRGVRLGLQVAGPLAQISSYVILMLSTMGVL